MCINMSLNKGKKQRRTETKRKSKDQGSKGQEIKEEKTRD